MFSTVFRRTCVTCGKEFETTAPSKKYCTEACKYGYGICPKCGKKFLRTGSTVRFCSKACAYATCKEADDHPCPICGKTVSSKKAIYCSKECKGKASYKDRGNCKQCGAPLRTHAHSKTMFCSRTCAAKFNNSNITNKKRIFIDKDLNSKRVQSAGYVEIKTATGWMLEHRYLMEQKLGRKLGRTDHVHHKNGNRRDNSLDNLELWIGKKDPLGQRWTDMLDMILAPYPDIPQQVLDKLYQRAKDIIGDSTYINKEKING